MTDEQRILHTQAKLRAIVDNNLSAELQATLSCVDEELEKEAARLANINRARSKDAQIHLGLSGLAGTDDSGRPFEAEIRGEPTLRGEPKRDSLQIGHIAAGTEITVLESDGDWFLIEIADPLIRGYVFGDFVEVKNSSEEGESASSEAAKSANAKSAMFLQSVPSALVTELLSSDAPTIQSDSPIADLSKRVNELADRTVDERPSFKQPAFQCRSELEICRGEGFGYIDCELTMLVCIAGVLSGGSSPQ